MEKYIIASGAGKFFVGDIYAVLDEKVIAEVWGPNFDDGKIEVDGSYVGRPGEEFEFVVYGTSDGGGCCKGQITGKSYVVDAGVIAAVPSELFSNVNYKLNRGSVFDGKELIMEVDDNYTFHFTVDGKSVEVIPTEEEDEEENEDEESEDDEEDSSENNIEKEKHIYHAYDNEDEDDWDDDDGAEWD